MLSLSVVRRSMLAAVGRDLRRVPAAPQFDGGVNAGSALPNSPREVEAPKPFWCAVTETCRRSLVATIHRRSSRPW